MFALGILAATVIGTPAILCGIGAIVHAAM